MIVNEDGEGLVSKHAALSEERLDGCRGVVRALWRWMGARCLGGRWGNRGAIEQ